MEGASEHLCFVSAPFKKLCFMVFVSFGVHRVLGWISSKYQRFTKQQLLQKFVSPLRSTRHREQCTPTPQDVELGLESGQSVSSTKKGFVVSQEHLSLT